MQNDKEIKISEFIFKKREFQALRKKQNDKCYVTGRDLTSANINGSHIMPIRSGGEHEFENLCLVVEEIREIKRKMTDEELVRISADIIKTLGKKYGYSIKTNFK
ncbi:HNH endonuclease [Leptospira sarikeiensis]|uniref:HNH endonuclease n=1 Tax=Leptospira sarikeiensis TaxID=2484943 RepID=A0A4R9K3N6_9LEPT|nr:hypothetical protein [Leptospira sarikeiensis]TGL59504.1 hypothetical protein EHQ64_15535 [Leptospira sarikeiensis]